MKYRSSIAILMLSLSVLTSCASDAGNTDTTAVNSSSVSETTTETVAEAEPNLPEADCPNQHL